MHYMIDFKGFEIYQKHKNRIKCFPDNIQNVATRIKAHYDIVYSTLIRTFNRPASSTIGISNGFNYQISRIW